MLRDIVSVEKQRLASVELERMTRRGTSIASRLAVLTPLLKGYPCSIDSAIELKYCDSLPPPERMRGTRGFKSTTYVAR